MPNYKIGCLVVVRSVDSLSRFRMWECICECGKVVRVRQSSLIDGVIVGCGCARTRNFYLKEKLLGPRKRNRQRKRVQLRQMAQNASTT